MKTIQILKYAILFKLFLILISACSTESKPVYNLSTVSNPVEGGTVSPSSLEANEGEQIEIVATPNEHWIFQSWQGDRTGTANPLIITLTSDLVITGVFIKREYPLTVEVEGEGTIQEHIVQSKTTNYVSGTMVELTPIPSDGWEFEEWQGSISGNQNPLIITINSNTSITAVFIEGNPDFAGGSGSSINPYQVSTLVQLQEVDNYRDKNFIQINDIDASESASWNDGKGFVPIGEQFSEFTGNFNGNDFNISGLTIDRQDEDYIGLFGFIKNAHIQKINLVDIDITGHEMTGGLVGQNDEGTVLYSTASGSITGSFRVGGLAGYNNRGSINNCSASATVSGNSAIGGLTGHSNQGTINNSNASGLVSGTQSTIGGLVGFQFESEIHNSFASGDVSGQSNTVGGLVGKNDISTITNSYSSGNVSGLTNAIGGLIGYNYIGQISRSYSSGNVSGTENVGGLIGFNEVSNVSNTYARGEVTGDDGIGGLIGTNMEDATISTSYASGLVTGNSDVGGLIGLNGASIDSGYWDRNTSNQSSGTGRGTSGGTTGLTTSQMTGVSAENNMTNFNWTLTWKTTAGYPILRWQD